MGEVYLHVAPFIVLNEGRLRRWDEICDELNFESCPAMCNWFETGEEAVQNMKLLKDWYSGLSESQSMWVWHKKVAGLNVVITTLPEHCDSDDSSNLSKIEDFPKLYQWLEEEAHEECKIADLSNLDANESDVSIIDEKVAKAFLDDLYDYLPGAMKITDEAAKILSKHEGALELCDLTELSDAAAESLSRHKGDLFLSSLSKLSDAAAESLSRHKGVCIILSGLTELSDAAAESLSRHKGELLLCGLIKLSDAAAESLSRHKGDLFLESLTELSDDAAKSLSKHEGQINDMDPKEWADSLRESNAH